MIVSLISELRRLRKEIYHEFKASLGNTKKLCLKQTKNQDNNNNKNRTEAGKIVQWSSSHCSCVELVPSSHTGQLTILCQL